jgi:PPM family protein phosphatase
VERDVPRYATDALQARLARFIAKASAPCAVSGSDGVWVGTNLGSVRERNEDRVLITFASYKTAPRKDFILAVLCDGIGGLSRGDDAAILAISVFVSRVLRTAKLTNRERLYEAALRANDAVYGMLAGRGGATLSAVLVNGEEPVVGVNIGDSRIYGISEARKLIQLSRDDTLAAILGKQDDDRGKNELLQFVGMGEGIEPQIIIASQSEASSFLVTSDGIHGAPSDALDQVVRNIRDDSDLIRRLIKLSNALGGHDNGTVCLLPAHVTTPNSHLDQGLTLSFLSPSDRLEIWIPVLADEMRHDRLPPALANTDEPAPDPLLVSTGLNSTKTRSHKKRSRLRKSPSTADKLPLEKPERPPLNVQFPGKDET